MAAPRVEQHLAGTGGFTVESPDGEIGSVEEVWLGEHDEPRALTVRTGDGKRALVLAEEVVEVDADHEWLVVRGHPRLLELAPTEVRDEETTASDARTIVTMFAGIVLLAAAMMTL